MPFPNRRYPSCLALVGPPIPSTEFSPPPGSELMMSNRAATGPEVACFRYITDYTEKPIPPTQATVGDLEMWKAESSGLTDTHEAAISPLRSFPPELLVEIFAQFVDMMMNYGLTPVPLMLMGICSQWRRIVLDTPRLWTKILTLHPMIDSWISRSKALPLYLDLDLPRPASDPIMEALIPHSHRWERVDFSIASSSNSVLTRVRTHLHSLRQLTLYFSDTTGTVDFCEVAPQLTQIDLVDILEPVVIKLPWEQLKVCTLDNAEIAHYVLQHAKNLRILRLAIAYEAPEPPSLMSRGPHSCHVGLNTLNLQWNHFAPEIDVNSFFSSITLPSLRTLEVHFSCLDPEGTTQLTDFDTNRAELTPILAGFFERSCTHLSTLTLTDIPFSQSGLIQCLAFAPSLVSLDVQFDGYWYAIKSKLLHRLDANHPKHILPHLRSLSLRGLGIFSEELLDVLVTSRRGINPNNDGVALLENLALEHSSPQNSSGIRSPRFQRFVSEGLKITYGEDRRT